MLIKPKLIEIVLAAIIIPQTASSDEWRDGSAHIICQPEKGFFELQTRQMYFSERDELEPLGFHFSRSLETKAHECNLGQHEIRVEGRHNITGKGFCGARRGVEAQVLINGKPLETKFEPRSSAGNYARISNSWFDLSNCTNHQHSVTIKSTQAFIITEVCRTETISAERSGNILSSEVSGSCYKSEFFRDDPYKASAD